MRRCHWFRAACPDRSRSWRTWFAVLCLACATAGALSLAWRADASSSDDHFAYLPVALGAAPTVSFQQRQAVFDAIRQKMAELEHPAQRGDRAVLAAYVAGLPAVTEASLMDDLSIWARFADGRRLVIAPSVGSGYTPTVAAAGWRAGLSAGWEGATLESLAPHLPTPRAQAAAEKVNVMNAMGTCYSEYGYPINQVRQWLSLAGYDVVSQTATVDNLKTLVRNTRLFFLETHGATGELRAPTNTLTSTAVLTAQVAAVATASQATGERDARYAEDLNAGRLAYFIAEFENGWDPVKGEKKCPAETHYGFTDDFVRQYLTFADQSFVFMNACQTFTNTASSFRAAFGQAGATAYIGWTDSVIAADAYRASLHLFDRLLGANQFEPETPPQRPFDVVNIFLADLAKPSNQQNFLSQWCRDTTVTPSTGCPVANQVTARLKIEALKGPNQKPFMVLRPILLFIYQSLVDPQTSYRLFTIIGQFDTSATDLRVYVGGQEVTIEDRFGQIIVARLPSTGAGASGEVVVVERGHPSNAVPLTAWRGQVTWREDWPYGLYVTGSCALHLRGDLHGYRDAPGGPVTAPAWRLMYNDEDYACQWQMGGVGQATLFIGGMQRTVEVKLVGNGTLNWTNSSSVGNYHDRDQRSVEVSFAVPESLGALVYKDLKTGDVFTQPTTLALRYMLPVAMPMTGYSIGAGTVVTRVLGEFDVRVNWNTMPASDPPTPQTPR